MSRMNLSEYVGHLWTIARFSCMFTIACSLVVALALGLRLGLDLVQVGKLLCTRICATLGCNCNGTPARRRAQSCAFWRRIRDTTFLTRPWVMMIMIH